MENSRPTSPAMSSTTTSESSQSSNVLRFDSSRTNITNGFSSKDPILQGYENFRKSSAPSRFLLFENNTWVDFPRQVFDELSAGFAAGKAVFEVTVGGNSYLFDFLHMQRFERSTKARSFIAWIDVDGQCFFPLMDTQVAEEEILNKVVERFFLNGMVKFDLGVSVTSIAKCLRYGLSRSSRYKTFQMMMEMTKEVRGVANMKFAWYGASKEDVEAIVDRGFEKPNSKVLGIKAHGHGLHLSSSDSPYASSLLSPADQNGEKHIVMCRVIMGNSERVEAGSLQSHPSDEVFDSGVDDLENPRWYIVWNSHMNTHIFPEYVVSFRTSNQVQGLRRAVVSSRRPMGCLNFRKLFSEMGRSLPSSVMQELGMLYNQHKEGKINKDTFIRRLRLMVGDKLLALTIRRLKGHC